MADPRQFAGYRSPAAVPRQGTQMLYGGGTFGAGGGVPGAQMGNLEADARRRFEEMKGQYEADVQRGLKLGEPIYERAMQAIQPSFLAAPEVESINADINAQIDRRRAQLVADGHTNIEGDRMIQDLENQRRNRIAAAWRASQVGAVTTGVQSGLAAAAPLQQILTQRERPIYDPSNFYAAQMAGPTIGTGGGGGAGRRFPSPGLRRPSQTERRQTENAKGQMGSMDTLNRVSARGKAMAGGMSWQEASKKYPI